MKEEALSNLLSDMPDIDDPSEALIEEYFLESWV